MRKINMEAYLLSPGRYELRRGDADGVPNCPFGNKYQWIGYDLVAGEYVRFTKSVFKILVKKHGDA